MVANLIAASGLLLAVLSSWGMWRLRRRVKRAERIVAVARFEARGIHKRLAELREIAEWLEAWAPALLEESPWVSSWIESQTHWTNCLIIALEEADHDFLQWSTDQRRRYDT